MHAWSVLQWDNHYKQTVAVMHAQISIKQQEQQCDLQAYRPSTWTACKRCWKWPSQIKKYNTHRLDTQMDGPIFIFNYGGRGGTKGGEQGLVSIGKVLAHMH